MFDDDAPEILTLDGAEYAVCGRIPEGAEWDFLVSFAPGTLVAARMHPSILTEGGDNPAVIFRQDDEGEWVVVASPIPDDLPVGASTKYDREVLTAGGDAVLDLVYVS